MTSQQRPDPDHRWMWDDAAWSSSPAAPSSIEQVPEPEPEPGGWSAAVRAVLRWASR